MWCAENAAGRAFRSVSRVMDRNQQGMRGHAEGVSGLHGQDGGQHHGGIGSANVNKPVGGSVEGESARTDEHAGAGITNAVVDNL